MPVVRIDIILHATEDVDKVLGSISNVLDIDTGDFTITKTEGHYHNPILRVLATLRGKRAAHILARIRSRLSYDDLQYLSSTLKSRINGSALYIRLSKQDIIHGEIVLQDTDAIRLRISVPAYNRSQDQVFRDTLGIK